MWMIPTVKDNPYLSEFECHYRKATPAGKETIGGATGVIARDSGGRTVQQFNCDHLGGFLPVGGFLPPVITIVIDPITQMLHWVDRESSTTLVSSRLPTGLSAASVPRDIVGATWPTLFPGSAPGDTFIGEKIIEGMRSRGYRRLGQGGQLIEFWVADELQAIILGEISWDGLEMSLRVHDIRQGEPNPELFAIPAPDQSDRIFDLHLNPL
jgi:hypothetical protein